MKHYDCDLQELISMIEKVASNAGDDLHRLEGKMDDYENEWLREMLCSLNRVYAMKDCAIKQAKIDLEGGNNV